MMPGSVNRHSAAESSQSGPLIGIVCALHREIAPFADSVEKLKSQSGNGFHFQGLRHQDLRICVVEGATGAERARQAALALIDAFQPDYVLSAGFSGALIPNLNIGDIVMADGVTSHDGSERLSIDFHMPASMPVWLHTGHLCMADHIIRLVSEKQELGRKTGAIAVDLESLAVARVCRDRSTRFMAIRSISDDLQSDLPPEVLAILGPKGTIRAGALIGSLLSRPNCVRDLWALRENSGIAANRLAQVLPGILDQLAASIPSAPS